jgi:acyl-CoA reductase-like NAD-dependent aldehyde dehydrogenase
VSPADGAGEAGTLVIHAPASGERVGEVAITTPGEVRAAIARARSAYEMWRGVPLEERCDRLLRFRDALVERADDLIEMLVKETGKPRQEALLHEVMPIVDTFTYLSRHAPVILQPKELPLHLFKHKKSVVHYVPRGVVGVISPWNFPFSIPMGDVAAALVTGSAVIVKPSEVTPLIMKLTKEIWDSTGLPADLFQVVHGRGDVGSALIEGGVQKIVFTGGVATGRKVAAACGAALVPCVMELGGKAPLIACADCDLERTARAIVWGGFANSGQVCVSVERVFAHREIYDALVERVKALTLELREGNPERGEVDVGAMTFAPQMDVADAHVKDALGKGATLVTGGQRHSPAGAPGQFYAPTVLADCTGDMTVMRAEIFGPIVPIARVDSEEEAITRANDSHLGLNAYVFTRDRRRGEEIALRLEAGSVLVNDVLTNHATPEAPFGGVKDSGFGRVHGDDALRDMAEKRHVMTERIAAPTHDPFWYPYEAKRFKLLRKGLTTLFAGKGLVQRIASIF